MHEVQDFRESLNLFQGRMTELEDELRSINKELGQQDLFSLARRTRDLVRRTKGLLDGNVTVLFEKKPPEIADELYTHLEWANGHVSKALSEEYEFDRIKQRLYMATSLADFVIIQVDSLVREMRERYV